MDEGVLHEEGLELVWAFGSSAFWGYVGMSPRSRWQFIASYQNFYFEFEVSVL